MKSNYKGIIKGIIDNRFLCEN